MRSNPRLTRFTPSAGSQGPWPMLRSEVRGQESGIRGQGSEVGRGQGLEVKLQGSGVGCRQSARLPYSSWKIEIRRDWYRSQNGRDLRGKSDNVYSGTRTFWLFHDRSNIKSVYRSTHFHFCPSISSNLASVPISSDFDFPA